MDLYKPQYHFVPKNNWMNDPNGPIYYKGKYHLFYQCNPNDYHWNTMHWGHAVSEDLVHWEYLPIALFPSNDLGETHCFSGCAVINVDRLPTIFYTSIGENERNARDGAEQWMAVSKDHMLTWEKYKLNPVMKSDIHGTIDIKEWRDPFIWKEDGKWYMVLGGSIEEKGGILMYSSMDLVKWEFLNVVFEAPNFKTLECPNMLKFGDKYVLVYSPSEVVRYNVGTINKDFKFISEYEGIIDNSGFEGFYAPNTLIDYEGRNIMWGWMTDFSRGEFQGANGWSGAQSIPRILTLAEDNSLRMEPAPEYKVLRYDEESYENKIIEKDKIYLEGNGRSLEIEMEIKINGDENFSLNVLESPDNQEKTIIKYDAVTREIYVDRSKSSLSKETHKSILKSQLVKSNGQVINIHVFVDHSVIEVFVDNKVCISTRIYPTLESSKNVSLELTDGKNLNIQKLSLWKMNSI